MSLASIRVRLPLTYAAVSLVAALVLGGALILPLREYYARRELAYLSGNARVIAAVVAELMVDSDSGRGLRALEQQMSTLSFVSRARVRVLDAQSQVLADSGSPTARNVIGLNTQRDQLFVLRGGGVTDLPLGALPGPRMVITALQQTLPESTDLALGDRRMLSVTTNATLYDFETDFIAEAGGRRSAQRVIEPIAPVDGARLGYVELSEGPAYGTDVVNTVLRGWLLASAAAVVLASLAGWWISRRISSPLLRLTDAAARMAAGDLDARAQVRDDGRDGGLAGAEIGGLARTFDEMAGRVAGTITTLRAFVSDAAHEINTPLMALQNQLELAESTSDGASTAHIALARMQAGRLAELSRSLLDLSRLEADVRSPVAAIELGAVLREVCDAAASRADLRGIRLDLQLPQTPVAIAGAAPLLRQALANVLDNALKFTPEGGDVRVTLDLVDAQARVQVLDTGIGIPGDEIDAVFDRFRRARNASAYAGNGLGLAIVRAIVALQGGAVTAGNRDPGPGVCVTLTWPTR